MAEEDKKEELKNRLESSINEDDSGNYAGALGFEIGVGLAADWLVASPDPLSRGLSFGIGYGANVIAQKIRGNEEFSHGEALAAGGFQAIPFGTTAKGLKGIGRATAKGAAIGVGGEQVRTAIDEQRLLTPGEALTAGTLGAGFGGTIKFGTESADILIRQARANRLSRQGKFWRQPGFDPESPNPIPNPWEDGKTFNRVDTTNREARRQTEIRLGVLNRMRMQIDDPPHQAPLPLWGTPGDRYGSLKKLGQEFNDYTELDLTTLEREIKAAIQDPGGTLAGGRYYWEDPTGGFKGTRPSTSGKKPKWRKADFERFANENKRQLKNLFTHLSSGNIEIHHINTLDTGVALHENLTRRGRLLTRARLFEVSGIASGNSPLNRVFLPGRVHDVAHAWITDNVGNQSWRILGRPGSVERRRWVQLPFDHPERLAKIDEYGALIKESEAKIAEIYKAYTELWSGVPKAESFQEVLKRLKLTEKEYDMLINPEGASSEIKGRVKQIIQEIEDDTVWKQRQDTLNRPQTDTSVPQVKRRTQLEENKERLSELRETWKNRNQIRPRLTKAEKDQLKKDIKILADSIEGKQQNLFSSKIYRTHN